MFGSICFLFNVGVLVYLLFLFTLHYTWFLRFNQDLAVPNVEDRSIATDRCQLPFDLFGGFTMYHMYIYIYTRYTYAYTNKLNISISWYHHRLSLLFSEGPSERFTSRRSQLPRTSFSAPRWKWDLLTQSCEIHIWNHGIYMYVMWYIITIYHYGI